VAERLFLIWRYNEMQDWLKAFHGANLPFPAMEIAVKTAVALALGLLVGLEREWSNKDIEVAVCVLSATFRSIEHALVGAIFSFWATFEMKIPGDDR
jgi:hypothetical protein